MKVVFGNTVKIAGIGLVPWTRLGLERWLPNYKIASLNDWDIAGPGVPEVVALHTKHPEAKLERLNSQHLLENPQFQEILKTEFAGYQFMTYKPVRVPLALQEMSFIAGDYELARRLENKAAFRTLMQDDNLPFPAYKIVERSAVSVSDIGELLDGRDSLVLQDELLSGGKGTFVVTDADSLRYALDSLARMRTGEHLVISDRVAHARERSVQCCVTKYGIFVGPLQKQIVGDPLLANLSVADGDKFCGAEISPQDELIGAYPEIKQLAETIGKRIQAMGYKGIFGLDCLVDEAGKVYVLEVNPRLTGVTPLLTALYKDGDIPFYLLHILELADIPYTIENATSNPGATEGSLLLLHSQAAGQVKITDPVQSGLYNPETLQFEQACANLDTSVATPQFLLQQYGPAGMVIKPGGRLVSIVTNRRVLSDTDALLPATKRQVTKILEKVEVRSI